MVDSYVRKLYFHGAAVIWIGLMAGFPFGWVVMGRMEGDTRAWHMAHLEGILNGLLMFGGAAALPFLKIEERRLPLYAWSFLLAGYGNVIASILAALVRQRGLELALPASNLAVFTMFVVAVVAVLTGLYLIMVGAKRDR